VLHIMHLFNFTDYIRSDPGSFLLAFYQYIIAVESDFHKYLDAYLPIFPGNYLLEVFLLW